MSAMSTIPLLPWDLIVDILSRVPVATLLRLRTVSMEWRTLIDSNEFTYKQHLLRSFNSYTFNLLLRSGSLYSLDLNTFEDQIMSDLVYKLKQPINCGIFISHCNGLFLFNKSDKEFLLWNPSTRKHQNIQSPMMESTLDDKETYRTHGPTFYGFGYGSVTDDYKMVKVAQLVDVGYTYTSLVDVYSSKLNLWRRVQNFPYNPIFSHGIFVGGGLHWLVTAKRKEDSEWDGTKLITAFDIETEEYCIVPQPQYENDVFDITIDVLGGCLCLVGHDYSHQHVSIWVMKEYGVESSWTTLLSLSTSVLTRFYHPPPDIDDWVPLPLDELQLQPIAYSKCGKKVLLQQNFEAFFWYDLENESLAYVENNWSQMWNYTGASVCVNSLVHLNDRLT